MAEETRNKPDPDAQAAAADGGDEAARPEAAGDEPPAEAGAAELEARVAGLEAEAADLRDKLLRALAETENVRRRGQRDREEASKYAIGNFAREMVGVADNLRRALEHVTPEARRDNELLESLAAGVEMTERAMLAALERFGIRPIEALGQKFDHNLHEAMFEVEDPAQPAGTIVHEMEKGYLLEDRLLRPSRVGVAKGGPRPANGDAEAAGESADAKATAKDQRAAYEKRSDTKGEAAGAKGAKVDEKL